MKKKFLVGLAVSICIIIGGIANATVIENFDDGDISNYSFISAANGAGDLPSVTSTASHDGPFGLEVRNEWWMYRDDMAVQLSQGDVFSAWISFNDIADARAYFGFGASALGTLSFVLAPNTGEILFQENAGFSSFMNLNNTSQAFAADKWYRAEVDWGLGGSLTGRLYDSDGTTLLNTVNAFSNLYTSGGIAFRGFENVKSFDTVDVQATAPVPEPSTALLLGIGLAGTALAGRRMRMA